jgi:hypothetical protein
VLSVVYGLGTLSQGRQFEPRRNEGRHSFIFIWVEGVKGVGLIDLHWVRALMVPMHLGLIDRSFVPHNLI